MTVQTEPLEARSPGNTQPEPDLDRRVVRGWAWTALGHGGHMALWVFTLFVLAHILSPADFGITSVAGTILIVLGYVQQAGVSTALVQRRHDLREAASSALVFTLVTGALSCGLIYVAAPWLASFFGEPELKGVIRVLAVAVAIRSVTWVGVGLLERRLAFGRAAGGELSGAFVEMGLAIGLAVAGAGVWSIVFGQLGGAVVQFVVTWALLVERPSVRHFDRAVLFDLLRFGRFVSAGYLLILFTTTIDTLFVGKILGAYALGFYALAYRLAALPGTVIGVVAERVTLPAYSLLQENREAFKRSYLANIRRLSLVTLPLGVTLIVAAEPLVVGLLGPKWEPAVQPLRILAVFGMLESLAGTTGSVFQAANRPQLVPITMGIGAAALVPMLWLLTTRYGTTGAAVAMTACLTPVAAARVVLASRIVGARPGEVARAFAGPVAAAALLAGALVGLSVATADLRAWETLAVLFVGGALSYGIAARFFAPDAVGLIVAGLRRSAT